MCKNEQENNIEMHAYKWTMVGGHLNFAMRELKQFVSTKNQVTIS